MKARLERIRVPAISVGFALVATWLLLVVVDAPPLEALWQIWNGSFGRLAKIPDTLIAWVPLVLAAAGLIVTFQAGMWNIGVEGQIVMGAIGSAWVVRELSGPAPVVIAVAFIMGAVFGAGWALIPGYLRTRFGVHEIFSGVALFFVAGSIAVFLIIGPWSRQGIASTSGTDPFDERYWLPTVGGDGYSWLAIVVAVVAVVAVAVLMRGTRYGLRLKAVGENSDSAFLMGIRTNAYMLSAFASVRCVGRCCRDGPGAGVPPQARPLDLGRTTASSRFWSCCCRRSVLCGQHQSHSSLRRCSWAVPSSRCVSTSIPRSPGSFRG